MTMLRSNRHAMIQHSEAFKQLDQHGRTVSSPRGWMGIWRSCTGSTERKEVLHKASAKSQPTFPITIMNEICWHITSFLSKPSTTESSMASKPSSLAAPSPTHGSSSFSRIRPLHLLAEVSAYPSVHNSLPSAYRFLCLHHNSETAVKA